MPDRHPQGDCQPDDTSADALDEALRAVDTACESGNYGVVMAAMTDLAWVRQRMGDEDGAADELGHALALARMTDVPFAEAACLTEMARLYAEQDRVEQSLAVAQQAQEILYRLADDPNTQHTLIHLAEAYVNLGQSDCALECVQRAVAIARDAGGGDDLITNLCALGGVHLALRQPDESVAAVEEAVLLSAASQDRVLRIKVLAQLADTYGAPFVWESHLDEAVEIAHELIESLGRQGDRESQLQAASSLARMLDSQGEPYDAVPVYQRGERLAQELGDPLAQLDLLSGLGSAQSDLGAYAEAASCYERALALAESHGRIRYLIDIRVRLVSLYHELGRQDEGCQVAHRAAELCIQYPHDPDAVHTLIGLADSVAHQGDLAAARSWLRKAIAMARAQHLDQDLAIALADLGSATLRAGEVDAAIGYLEEAIERAVALEHVPLYCFALGRLADAHEARGDLALALELWQEQLDLLREQGQVGLQARVLWDMANVHVRLSEEDVAVTMYRQALDVAESCDESEDIADTAYRLGMLLARRGDRDDGIALLRQAAERYHALGMSEEKAVLAELRNLLDGD